MTEREIRREVERAFYEYKARRNRAATYIADTATQNLGVDYNRVRVSGGDTDFDGKIVAMMDANRKDYLWCRVVELTKERFALDGESNVIIERYFRGNRRYRRSRMLNICCDLYLSETVFYDTLKKIFSFAVQIALQLQLITIIPIDKI